MVIAQNIQKYLNVIIINVIKLIMLHFINNQKTISIKITSSNVVKKT